MPASKAISNLKLSAEILDLDPIPRVSGWNRLEGRPREVNFERSLRAEIRDPLWMLSRQWQTGEFQGEDAGTAVEAKFVLETTRLSTFTDAKGNTSTYDDSIPMEVRVERETLRFDFFTRIQVGKMWAQMLNRQGLGAHLPLYLTNCPFDVPGSLTEQDYFDSNPDAVQLDLFAQNRLPNGEKLLAAIVDGTHAAWLAANAEAAKLLALGTQLQQHFGRVYNQPEPAVAEDSWKPERLEYQFSVAAPESGQQEITLHAEQYYHDHLDWYNFDFKNARPVREATTPERIIHSYIPTPVQFYGMPNRRWWTLEDGQTDLGKLNVQTTDIATLLFAEFALVFSNDWQILPCELPVGSLNGIGGILVTDVFGVKTWVRPIGRGEDDNWQRWRMFTLNTEGLGGQADTRLFLPPALVKTLNGEPLEEVRFIRDEMANMVWAIERRVAVPTGVGKDGYEINNQLLEYLRENGLVPVEAPAPPPPDGTPPAAPLKYILGTQVPRNWIPFIPVKISSSFTQIRLQKATMPEFLERVGYPAIVQARTSFLQSDPYFVNEEEVPRAGAVVKKSFQRTRWYNGKTFTWVGKRKEVGRGEGTSGLVFDQLIQNS